MVPFSFADVHVGKSYRGASFSRQKAIPVSGAADYEAKLEKNFVLCRPEVRRKKIEAEILRLTAPQEPSRTRGSGLLELVTYLNEYPTVIIGRFRSGVSRAAGRNSDHGDARPPEVLCGGEIARELAPHFLAVINLPADPKGLVRAGHERVLRARFADAQFFWEADQKIPLGDYLPKLGAVTYERRLGSYGDESGAHALARAMARGAVVQRRHHPGGCGRTPTAPRNSQSATWSPKWSASSPNCRESWGALRAGARRTGRNLPRLFTINISRWASTIRCREILTGCAVALADKLDSLVACFAVGAIPTGSSDPFALRRAALGIVKIILERKLPLSISAAISAAAQVV